MSGLQFMRFKRHWYLDSKFKLVLPQGLKFRGDKLRYLQWNEFPMKMLPREFNPQFLVKLEMRNSKLKKLWKEPIPLPYLKKIDLDGSVNLRNLPNLSKATNLEVLIASDCKSLVEIPSTIGKVTSLQKLILSNCFGLKEIPSTIGEVTSLQELDLCNCYNLKDIPSTIGNATNIEMLNFRRCKSLVVLPSSIWSLKRLEHLDITLCSKLKHLGSQLITSSSDISAKFEFPSSIIALSCLRKLNMQYCKSLKVFPNVPEGIEELLLDYNRIEEVPSSIQNLSSLTKLSMKGCRELKILPTNINMESLKFLDLSYCKQLKTFPEISTSIVKLNMRKTAIEEVPSSILSWSSLLDLNFGNCPNLSQEAKELISKCKRALLLGKELPGYFDHQTKGDLLTINLEDQRPFPLFLRFKACLLLLNGEFSEDEDDTEEDEVYDPKNNKRLSCCIWGVHNSVDIGFGSCKYNLPYGSKEHLYFIESSISIETDVKFSELVFQFKITRSYWGIEECGVTLMYNDDDYGSIYKEKDIIIKELSMQTGTVRARNNFRRKREMVTEKLEQVIYDDSEESSVSEEPLQLQVSVGKKKGFQRIWSSTLGSCCPS